MIALTDCLSVSCHPSWTIQDPDVTISKSDGLDNICKVCLDMIPFLQGENDKEPLRLTFSTNDTSIPIYNKALSVTVNARFVELYSVESSDGSQHQYVMTNRGKVAEKQSGIDLDLFVHSIDINLANSFMLKFASLKPSNARTCVLFGLELEYKLMPVSQTSSVAAPSISPNNHSALPIMFSQFLIPSNVASSHPLATLRDSLNPPLLSANPDLPQLPAHSSQSKPHHITSTTRAPANQPSQANASQPSPQSSPPQHNDSSPPIMMPELLAQLQRNLCSQLCAQFGAVVDAKLAPILLRLGGLEDEVRRLGGVVNRCADAVEGNTIGEEEEGEVAVRETGSHDVSSLDRT